MPKYKRLPLLPGTLEMLVLQSLVFGPRHGHGIATTSSARLMSFCWWTMVRCIPLSSGLNDRG
jgi:hypothetical protein